MTSQSSLYLHQLNHQNVCSINEHKLSMANLKQHQRVSPHALPAKVDLAMSEAVWVVGQITNTHMLSLSCASRAFSQTKPLRHIGNGTVMPKDFMHTIQIHTSQHCSSMSLYISSVVLNWFCFRTQILHWTLRGETKIVYCPNIPKTWNVNPSNL